MPMNPEIKEAWIEALTGGEYQQTRSRLCRENLITWTTAYCCLGVLSEMAVQDPKSGVSKRLNTGPVEYFDASGGVSTCDLIPGVTGWAGIDTEDPDVFEAINELVIMNDSGRSFDTIAQYIREESLVTTAQQDTIGLNPTGRERKSSAGTRRRKSKHTDILPRAATGQGGRYGLRSFAKVLAEREGITPGAAQAQVQEVLDLIAEVVSHGHVLSFTNFGTFQTTVLNQRRARNPQTGETVIVPRRPRGKFAYTGAFKEALESRTRITTVRKAPKSF